MPAGVEITSGVYKPRDPRTTALYEVVRDNLETLYGAIGDGAIAVRIPKHAPARSWRPTSIAGCCAEALRG